jgi:hypothetical protein
MILKRPSGPSILSHPPFVTVAAAAGCPSDRLPSTCALREQRTGEIAGR